MKKWIITSAAVCGLIVSPLAADHLKDSLHGLLKKKEETPSMVNLEGLDLNGRAKPIAPKTRSSKAVIATVDGHKIIKKEADIYLAKRTKGKIKDFDLLPKKQRMELVKELALPILLAEHAQKELSAEEKEAVISRAWMQKAVMDAKVPEEELKSAYEKIKAQATAKNPLQQFPPYEKIKDRIKLQVGEQQVIRKLLRGVDISVDPSPTDQIIGHVGMFPVSRDEVNKALQKMTQGKMTWATLPPSDKQRVLQMIAPAKLAALNAESGLTKQQKDAVLANYWMQKSLAQTKVSEDEVKKRYAKIKKMSQKSKRKQKLPPLSEIEKSLKMQIAQEKIVGKLIKQAHIKLK